MKSNPGYHFQVKISWNELKKEKYHVMIQIQGESDDLFPVGVSGREAMEGRAWARGALSRDEDMWYEDRKSR